MDSSSLEGFKRHVDLALVGLVGLQGVFQPYWFFDSVMFTNEVWEEGFGEVAPIGAGDRSASSMETS